MPSNAWGLKRTCPDCKARFYDLNKNPAKCPKCGSEFDPEAQVKPRRGRGRKAGEKPAIEVAELKKKPVKKAVGDDDAMDLGEFEDIEPVEGMDDIEEMEELDDTDGIEEIDEIDEPAPSEDETDEELLLEEMDAGDDALIDDVDEDEDEDEEDDEDKIHKKSKPVKKASVKKK